MQWGARQSQSKFRPTNHTKPLRWCQPIGGHVSYPTDSPTATRLGLCSSLQICWINHHCSCQKWTLQSMLKKCCMLNCMKNLTHWNRVKHICVSKLTIICSDNGLSPGRRQAIIWTNAGILLIGPLGTNFSEILNEIQTFSLKKMHLKMSSGKWRPFCLGLNVLIKAEREQWHHPPGVWWHNNMVDSLHKGPVLHQVSMLVKRDWLCYDNKYNWWIPHTKSQ